MSSSESVVSSPVSTDGSARATKVPHPAVWMILYLPFGAFSGFVVIALGNQASSHGINITDAALIVAAQLLLSWLKWLWAPIVDVTLTPRRWYAIATVACAAGIFAMSLVPLSPANLGLLIAIILASSFASSLVGMAVEALMSSCTPVEQAGRASAWLQAGNLGGNGLGGALGLTLFVHLEAPWMSGAIVAGAFIACCFALLLTPRVPAQHAGHGFAHAVGHVVRDLWAMLRTKSGLLAMILFVLPVGTGAAQGVLTQDAVAAYWHAGPDRVALVQGLLAGLLTITGCFAGGYLCERFPPRATYAANGVFLAAIAVGMGVAPHGPDAYVGWSLAYSFGVGLAYASFTAVILSSMGKGSGATKYNVYASLANFPLWWLGLLLGRVADVGGARGAPLMLFTEAGIGVVGVGVFFAAVALVRRSRLPD